MYQGLYMYSLSSIVSQCYTMKIHNDIRYFKVKNRLRRLLLQLLHLSRKVVFLVKSNALGNLKLKYNRQSSIIDILFVLNSLIRKWLTTKSKEFKSDLFRQQASVPIEVKVVFIVPNEYSWLNGQYSISKAFYFVV